MSLLPLLRSCIAFGKECRFNRHFVLSGGSAIFVKNKIALTLSEIPNIDNLAVGKVFEISIAFLNRYKVLLVYTYQTPYGLNAETFMQKLGHLFNVVLSKL